MNDVLFRIRKVFRDSKKNQTEIGKAIGKTSQYVWKLLNDDTANPSNSVVKDICREFDINEEWLRTGTGEMYVIKNRSETIAAFAGNLMQDEEESFRRRLVEALAQLDESEWELLEEIAKKAVKKD